MCVVTDFAQCLIGLPVADPGIIGAQFPQFFHLGPNLACNTVCRTRNLHPPIQVPAWRAISSWFISHRVRRSGVMVRTSCAEYELSGGRDRRNRSCVDSSGCSHVRVSYAAREDHGCGARGCVGRGVSYESPIWSQRVLRERSDSKEQKIHVNNKTRHPPLSTFSLKTYLAIHAASHTLLATPHPTSAQGRHAAANADKNVSAFTTGGVNG
ncbi:hypothetical protein DFJ77DRAFT_39305 [Powellomyces hirtus]|nr:hypothetical protein DFJ77DRAFT_39305 [Powellomyces hirtus]